MESHTLESYSSPGRGTQVSVWHVAVSSDDVKVMTLEQLDDAFRLDVIDTSTPVWKAGMSTWSTLGVVAGIEDETTTAQAPTRQEPAALWPPPAWPPQAGEPNAVSNRDAAPRTRSPAPPVLRPTVPPSGPNTRSATPAPAPTVRVSAPSAGHRPAPPSARPAAPSSRTAPQMVQVQFGAPASIAPAAYSVAPSAYVVPRRSGGSFGRWMLGLAVLAGLTLTLYRNDVFLRLARSAHLEEKYLRVERSFLGGPTFGTLRSIDTLKTIRDTIAALPIPGRTETAAAAVAPPPVEVAQPAAPAVTAKANDAPPASAAKAIDLHSLPVEGAAPAPESRAIAVADAKPPVKASLASSKAPAVAPKAEKPVVVAEKEPSDSLKAAMSSKAAKAVAPKKEASSETAAPPAKEPAKTGGDLPRTSSGGLDLKAAIGDAVRRHPPKKKSKGSEYDPLNGDL